jgi:hypothetical protein
VFATLCHFEETSSRRHALQNSNRRHLLAFGIAGGEGPGDCSGGLIRLGFLMFHHRLLGQFLVALLSTGFHRIHLGCCLVSFFLLFHQDFIGFTQGERLFLTGLGSRRDLVYAE